ncbi:cation transporter [Salicibibacter cibarius]|uniref:Cation transporter n=1 Tax=Salicibibacter cibarius TaxID=2743000 RepID=A0A7T7CDF6_9BACI|nr:cation diffusion facilitator family transporter [Salicibibacter cibarius]QQK77942.1 cation transporter [Salicibibacter cibarius]
MSHNHHHHHHTDNKKALLLALLLIFILVIAEVIGGLLTNSLALMADAGHMLSDFFAIGLALIAFKVGERAASKSKTFGYRRFEILAALINGVVLIGISVFVFWQAIQRFQAPPEVAGGGMLAFASFALFINLLVAWIFLRGGDVKGNLNLRGAFFHVLGDIVSTIGVLVAGLLILFFNWTFADPIISIVVALLILTAGFRIASESVHVLMEGKPASISLQKIEKHLKELPHVHSLHDLHLWSITSDFPALSCHLVVEEGADRDALLRQATHMLKEEFRISHAVIQMEGEGIECTSMCSSPRPST